MNIFLLDSDINKNVQSYGDKHVVKMIVEHAQMLSATVRLAGYDAGYRLTHKNHPCTIWTRESQSNYNYLRDLTEALHKEWQFRFNHTRNHKSWDMIETLPDPKLEDNGLTPFAQAMPDEYRDDDAIIAYRKYYLGEKKHLFKWTKRNQPEWTKHD